MPTIERTIRERLVKIEVLLGNHLAHHDLYFRWVIIPIGIMTLLLLAKAYAPDMAWAIQSLVGKG